MSKINIVVRLQHWMDSVPGQTFLNYAYSWGASIVILGALFKLTHLPGGNFMLFIGMGTEVVVFFLSAFDRPFDKEEIGKELPHDVETDEQIAERLGLNDDDDEEEEEEEENIVENVQPAPSTTSTTSAQPAPQMQSAPAQPTIIIGTAVSGQTSDMRSEAAAPDATTTAPQQPSAAAPTEQATSQRSETEAAQAAIAAVTSRTGCPLTRNGGGYTRVHCEAPHLGRNLPEGGRTECSFGAR